MYKRQEQLFSQIQEGEVKDLNLIIKGDVQGSIGAIVSSLEKLNNENVRVKIVHTGVGTVTESDVMLAGTTGSVIIGFNVRPTTACLLYTSGLKHPTDDKHYFMSTCWSGKNRWLINLPSPGFFKNREVCENF